MIEHIELTNFMLFDRIRLEPDRFNILIGDNDTGKTALLKVIYAVLRAYQEYKEKGKRDFSEVLSSKILWTFTPVKMGSLVKRGADKAEVCIETGWFSLRFSFSRKAKAEIKEVELREKETEFCKCLLFPPKEVFSITEAVRVGREEKEKYWFDDTYYTLVQAISRSLSRGRLSKDLEALVKDIRKITNGGVEKKEGGFYLKRGRNLYEMPIVAEGVRKIAVIEWLIRNKEVEGKEVLLFDEPETGLNPSSVIAVADVLYRISKIGVSVFVATHSYFFLKKAQMLAKRYNDSDVKVFVLKREGDFIESYAADLISGIPDNVILNVALDLYNEDIKLSLEEIRI